MLPRRNKQNDTSMCGCVRGNYFSLHEKVNVLSLHILIELLYVLKKKKETKQLSKILRILHS